MSRMQELYEKKGYPKEWIDKRLRGIAVRQDLTDEWKQRGATNSQEFAILTNEIMHGTFALKVDEYKQLKALARENLRDHMTDIELILTMLAEATTTKLHRDRESKGMMPLKKDAKDGGAVAGRTRKDIEKQTGYLSSEFQAVGSEKKQENLEVSLTLHLCNVENQTLHRHGLLYRNRPHLPRLQTAGGAVLVRGLAFG
jgi:hypothetical protein